MEQAKTTLLGQEVRRWYVFLDTGRRVITWAATANDARAKATAKGYSVRKVSPAPHLI
jgi:hypothetical protein